jgi:hypothetical protein
VGGCSGVHLIAKKGAADFMVNFSFFNRISVGDIKSWGQFSSLFIITVWYKARIATQCSYA